MDFDLRNLIHPQRLVLMKVGLLHTPFLDRDRPAQGRAQAINDSAFDLLYSAPGIDDLANIDSRHHPVHFHFALLDRYLRNLRAERSAICTGGDALEMPSGERFAPAGLLRSEIEHRDEARCL